MKFKKHIFISSYGRSGSTLLKNIVETIPNSYISGENNNCLYYLYLSYKKIKEAQEKISKSLSQKSGSWENLHEIDLEKYKRKLLQVFVSEILNPPSNTNVLGFKEIRFVETENDFEPFLNFLFDSFKKTKFLFIFRKHKDVSNSAWWKKLPKESSYAILNKNEDLMKNYCKLYPEKAMICRYDEILKCDEEIKKIFNFLEEDINIEKIKEIIKTKYY